MLGMVGVDAVLFGGAGGWLVGFDCCCGGPLPFTPLAPSRFILAMSMDCARAPVSILRDAGSEVGCSAVLELPQC